MLTRHADDVAGGRRLRLVPRTLAGRLVAGVVVLVAGLVLVFGSSTFLLLKQFLHQRLDAQVSSVAVNNAASFRCDAASSAENVTCNLGFQDYAGGATSGSLQAPLVEWIAVFNTDSNKLANLQPDQGGPRVMDIYPSTAQMLVDSSTPQTIRTGDGHRLVAAAARLPGRDVYLITGLGTDAVDTTLGRLLLVEVLIGTGAIALTLVVTLTGVSYGLRSLRRVTTTAQDVTAELSSEGAGLDRRVPVDPRDDSEVGQLATSVNTLLGAVETQFAARLRSEDRMREFLADASHELRTPLTTIRGFAELARMQRRQAAVHEGLDPATVQDDALDRIESEGTRMSRLVDDLLLLARGDHGAAPARERVEVFDMVRDVVDSARVAHPDRPMDLSVTPGLAVLGDRDQLLRVVRNLVTNAAVHTAPGGPVLVRAHAEGEEVVIQVADSGPGLDPEQAAHVFERFWRADKARTRVRGGSGLGMSIVATIVANHQGAVRFDSSPATGSTVTVILPAAPPGS